MDDLFTQSPLLPWLPGETLFSLVSRHHYFRANANSATTCEQFFGHPRLGTQHDFPSGLDVFVNRTGGRLGSVIEIARRHTLLAYYGAFASEEELRHLTARMAGCSVAHLKLRLGILTSRFRAHHPLKACLACIQEDRATHGWSYWHVEHQFPGVWVCLKHDQPLQESDRKANGVHRFLWHVPSEMRWESSGRGTTTSPVAFESARALSATMLKLVNLAEEKKVDLESIHEIYRAALAQRGWVTPGGSVRMSLATASFLEHVRVLRHIPELQALPRTEQAAAAQLGRIFRRPRSGIHPLRHAVVCQWLFGGAVSSLAHTMGVREPSLIASASFSHESARPQNPDGERQQKLLCLLTEQHLSLRQASLRLGIDVGTAIVWATAAGMQVGRRPKKLAGQVRQTAISALRQGANKAKVANEAGVAIGTITKLLFGEVGLHAAWQAARQTEMQAKMRQDWLDTRRANPVLSIKYLRSLNPATYAWLYRNDREWLWGQKPAESNPSNQPGIKRVRWDERDHELSAAVQQTVHQLVTGDGHKKLMLWQLCQALPELRAKLNALARLPLTRRAIDEALGRLPRESHQSGDWLAF